MLWTCFYHFVMSLKEEVTTRAWNIKWLMAVTHRVIIHDRLSKVSIPWFGICNFWRFTIIIRWERACRSLSYDLRVAVRVQPLYDALKVNDAFRHRFHPKENSKSQEGRETLTYPWSSRRSKHRDRVLSWNFRFFEAGTRDCLRIAIIISWEVV